MLLTLTIIARAYFLLSFGTFPIIAIKGKEARQEEEVIY